MIFFVKRSEICFLRMMSRLCSLHFSVARSFE